LILARFNFVDCGFITIFALQTRVVSPKGNTSSAKATILGICWRRWERAALKAALFS
jgi:hypothetical protein